MSARPNLGRIPAHVRAEMRRLYAEGLSRDEIAARTGYSAAGGVYRVVRDLIKRKCHGHATSDAQGRRSPTYIAWRNMLARCENERDASFPNYGGRGVTVCERWHDFAAFLADVGERPAKGMTLERIDNAKRYEPGNVRWATRVEQARNKRNNHVVTWRGESRCLAEWSARLGFSSSLLGMRLRRGWSVDDAFTRPASAGASRGET